MNARSRREPEIFTSDGRPGADGFVYCKGCGTALAGQARRQQPRVQVTVMMCDECRERHGHALMPNQGSPTFCYRCGTADVIIVEKNITPITHHVCPRCVPERVARYRTGNFRSPEENRPL